MSSCGFSSTEENQTVFSFKLLLVHSIADPRLRGGQSLVRRMIRVCPYETISCRIVSVAGAPNPVCLRNTSANISRYTSCTVHKVLYIARAWAMDESFRMKTRYESSVADSSQVHNNRRQKCGREDWMDERHFNTCSLPNLPPIPLC